MVKPAIGITGHVGTGEHDGNKDISIISLRNLVEIIDTVLYKTGILYKLNYFYILL